MLTTEDWDSPLVELQSSPRSRLHQELDLSPGTVTCFPQAVGIRTEEGSELRGTRYIPIDFGSLTEANAQMLQREVAFHEFGQTMRQALVAGDFSTVTNKRDPVEILNSTPVPYDTVDFLLGRVARAGGQEPNIHPDTIFRVTEWAMGRTKFLGLIQDRGSVLLNTPGQALAWLIENELTADKLNGPALELDDLVEVSAVTEWIEYIEHLPDWRDILEDGALDTPLRIIYSYVMKEVAKPLLTRKLDREFLKRYTTLSGYLELRHELPAPFIVASENGFEVSFPDAHKDRLLGAWIKYCFEIDILSQMLHGSDVLLCTRRHGFLAQWKHVNLCAGQRTCQEFIDLALCGEWGEQSRQLPKCLFSNFLTPLGYVSPTGDKSPWVISV